QVVILETVEGPGFAQQRRRGPDVPVSGDGPVDQPVEHRILERAPPFHDDRVGDGARRSGLVGPLRFRLRLLVVRPDLAPSGEQRRTARAEEEQDRGPATAHSEPPSCASLLNVPRTAALARPERKKDVRSSTFSWNSSR